MTAKKGLVKFIVHVRKSWIEETGASEIFMSMYPGPSGATVSIIFANECDVAWDSYFAEVVFQPRILEKEPVKTVKVLIPKHEILMVVPLEAPEEMSALGYRPSR